jgi:hypothetical protein
MIALSVIVIPSGQTFVQHFVMFAVPDTARVPQLPGAVLDVERVHLHRRRVDQESRSDERLVQPMVTQHVADVLAQEALDALPELLYAVDVGLGHAPGPVRSVGPTRVSRNPPGAQRMSIAGEKTSHPGHQASRGPSKACGLSPNSSGE